MVDAPAASCVIDRGAELPACSITREVNQAWHDEI